MANEDGVNGRAFGENMGDAPAPIDTRQAIHQLTLANQRAASISLELVAAVRHDSELREKKIQQLQKQSRQTNWSLLAIGVAILLILFATVINTKNLNETRHINQFIQSCFDPNGDCAKRSAGASRQRILDLQRYDLVLVDCSRQYRTDDVAWKACVNRLYPDGPNLIPDRTGR